MGPYLIWADDRGEVSLETGPVLKTLGPDPAWRRLRVSPRCDLFLSSTHPLSFVVRADRKLVLLGEAFPVDPNNSLQDCLAATLGLGGEATADQLLSSIWGRYVLVCLGQKGGLEGALRDPSGALGAVSWTVSGGTILTSAASQLVTRFPPKDLGVDWEMVTQQLADPLALAAGCSLRGLRALAPGAFRNFASGRDQALWRPADFARWAIESEATAGEALVHATDRCIVSLASMKRVAVEVSGGLDSALVATGLHAAGLQARAWLHQTSADLEVDERVYAQAVMTSVGGRLSTVHLEDALLDLKRAAEMQSDILPSVASFEPAADDAFVDICRKADADVLFTGMGGDSVLWSAPTRLILADRFERTGFRNLFSPEAMDLARWLRVSLLDIVRQGRAARGRAAPVLVDVPAWVNRSSTSFVHPWLQGVGDVAPTKQLQIHLLVLIQASLGMTPRREALDVVHPLLAQPVLETCLRIPIDVLVAGGRDRGLARRAFASRLPAIVKDRRSKGDTTKRSARCLASALEPVRELLLGGRLVERGLINPGELDVALSEEALSRTADLLTIYRTIAIELWVREWEAKIAQTLSAGGDC